MTNNNEKDLCIESILQVLRPFHKKKWYSEGSLTFQILISLTWLHVTIHPHRCHWLRRFIFPLRLAARPCRARRPPKHGAVACDDWMFGRFCSPFCNDLYDFAQALPLFSVWACGASGVWLPPGNWPDCAGINYELLVILCPTMFWNTVPNFGTVVQCFWPKINSTF